MKYKFSKENHLHTLNGKPLTGTSSIVSVLAKPLTYWASGLAVAEFGWLNPKKFSPEECQKALQEKFKMVKGLSDIQYGKLLDKAYRAHATNLKKTAKAGTDLHAELERFVKSEMGKNKENHFDKQIQPYIDWSKKNVKKYIASEAHCYSEKLWVGGIFDAMAELNDGNVAIIDFKSSRDAYPSQFLQSAGYVIQVEENGLFSQGGEHNKKIDQKITQLIIVPFGAEKVEPKIRNNIGDYKKGFEASVVLYRLLGLEKN